MSVFAYIRRFKEKSIHFLVEIIGDFPTKYYEIRLIILVSQTPDTSTENYCIEPWFKRYLVLNKFIHYSRLVILKYRLLKNLEKLKKMDKDSISELEKKHLKCKNVSYSEVFAKFLYS